MKINATVKLAQKMLIELIRANRITFLINQPGNRADRQLFVTDMIVNDNEGREDLQISLDSESLTKAKLEAVLSIDN